MHSNLCSIEVAHAPNGQPRGVGFLIYSQNSAVTAKSTFDGLDDDEQNYFRTSFDYWVIGKHINRRFHGWNKRAFSGVHTDCFVFKQDAHRLYGFLDHPKDTEPGYQFCILVAYAWKVKDATEQKHLIHCDQLSGDRAVQNAAKALFLPSVKGARNGKH